MTPSGDMPDPMAQQQSFSLANIVPQTAELNRGAWVRIESAVRTLVKHRGEAYVVTGPAFQGANLQQIGGRVLVPTSTWKAIYVPATGDTGRDGLRRHMRSWLIERLKPRGAATAPILVAKA